MANVNTDTLSWEGATLSLKSLRFCQKFSATDIIKMREFLIDNIFAMFVGRIYLHRVGTIMEKNYAPLLAGLFLYSYKADFIQWLFKENEKKIVGLIP